MYQKSQCFILSCQIFALMLCYSIEQLFVMAIFERPVVSHIHLANKSFGLQTAIPKG